MTFAATNGLPGNGTGPAPLSALFSDRAGEEASAGAASGADPLAQVLRTLDSISAAELEVGDDLRTVAPASPAGVADDVQDPATVERPAVSSRREEILDAASSLFAERGYHGASLRDISRRVGISHPGMLHHFSSKDALLSAVIDRLEAHAQGLLDSVSALQTSPQSLLAALAGPWDPRQHSMALLSTLSAEVVNPDHPGRFRIARLRLVHEHVLEKALTGLKEHGDLVEDADPKFFARLLFSLLMSLTVREHTVRELQKTADADPIEDVRELMRRLIAA
ncbi:TetR/AcrR family transcriptional regulator [Brachybacterium saurashtrense]|uniref:TetR/AcrR family transcriptional regulator n=1 Tax=Brachybacterium saurashtrense TaxID=556288 RepID=A0A345YQM4_9MICO|nr:TetR/AcrR family transcriptional regulator [Brachybacterium saurashtrense]AXK46226.1 TetR/AcrR family transcriptional regulator [Brachybacterium saurashtrense]RRR23966.1 TetR/AcrR family transcriptional regulator [Brachybacterium saurashtrense]